MIDNQEYGRSAGADGLSSLRDQAADGVLPVPASIPSAVVAFPSKARPRIDAANPELWRAILRVMEANGRTKIEIGIEDARAVLRFMEDAGNGRKQAPQAEVPASGKRCAEMGRIGSSPAQKDRGANRLDPLETNEAVESLRHTGPSRACDILDQAD